jgi:O-antigen ligase
MLRQILLFGPVLLLMFSVMAFGTTQEWSIFTLRAGAAGFVLLWAVWQAVSGEIRVVPNRLYWPTAAFLGVLAIQVVFRTSAYGWVTRYAFMQYLAYAALLFVVTQAIRSEADFSRLLIVMTIFGFVLAVFGLVQGFTSTGKIYWSVIPREGGWIYGPYVNHNHYAGMVEMLVPVPFVLAALRSTDPIQRALFAFIGTMIGATAFTCQSRAGMIAVTLELIFLAAFLVQRRKSATASLGIAVSAILLLSLLAWLGGLQLLERFQEMRDITRLSVLKDSFTMVKAKPFLGWGAGTFPEIYPHFRSFYTDLFVNQAHNDVLQLLIETGLIGFSIGIWFVVSMYRSASERLRSSRLTYQEAWVLASIVGCTGILFHSLFDFNLHIAANAAWFYVLASTIGISSVKKAKKPAPQPSPVVSAN